MQKQQQLVYLPHDICLSVFQFLHPREVLQSVCLVSKQWLALSQNNALWRAFQQHFFASSNNKSQNEVEQFRMQLAQHSSALLVRNRLVDLQGNVLTQFAERHNIIAFAQPTPGLYSLDGFLDVDAVQGQIVRKTRGLLFDFKKQQMQFFEHNGSMLWSAALPTGGVNCIYAHHLEQDDILLLSVQTGLLALQRTTGKQLWRNNEGPYAKTIAHSHLNMVFAMNQNFVLQTWNATTGEKLWHVDAVAVFGSLLTRLFAIADEHVLMVTEDYKSFVLDKHGKLVLELHNEILKNFCILPGYKMLANTDQRLVCLQLPFGDVIWEEKLPQGSHAMNQRYKFFPLPDTYYTRNGSKNKQDVIMYNYYSVYKKLRTVQIVRLDAATGHKYWDQQISVQKSEESDRTSTISIFQVRLYGQVKQDKFCLVSQLPLVDRLTMLDLQTGQVQQQVTFAR